MRITNLTGDRILCLADKESFVLDHEQGIDVDSFETMKFFHKSTNYSIKECSYSRVLKALSFFDDPFQLRREYYLMVDSEITKSQVCNSSELTITANTTYADVDTRTYYVYFVLICDGKQIVPSCVYIPDIDRLLADFTKNNRRLVCWNAVWDVLIEPIIFELIGFCVIYHLFTLWIGTAARYAVLFLLVLSVFIEIVILILKTNTKQKNNFHHYLKESIIQKICYKKI